MIQEGQKFKFKYKELSIYDLHALMSKLLLYVSFRTFLMTGKASRSDATALPSFALYVVGKEIFF